MSTETLLQQTSFEITAGYCPDPDFCLKIGGCISRCTAGPSETAIDIASAPQNLEQFAASN